MSLRGLFKPEYLYRPRQLFRRLCSRFPTAETVEVRLPWNATIRVHPHDNIGSAVCTLGVFDLAVSESIWRLADPGETVVDAGANFGYMTAVFAHRVGSGGKVFSFEPHPVLFNELLENVSLLRREYRVDFNPLQLALGDQAGILRLCIPPDFASNRGVASIAVGDGAIRDGEIIEVPATTLDDVLAGERFIGVMKLDVEGFELQVLRGARRLLTSRRIRDIIFEHHEHYPTDVTNFLENEMGLKLFRLHRRFRQPKLLQPGSAILRTNWESTSFVATYDVERLQERFEPAGWKCLA